MRTLPFLCAVLASACGRVGYDVGQEHALDGGAGDAAEPTDGRPFIDAPSSVDGGPDGAVPIDAGGEPLVPYAHFPFDEVVGTQTVELVSGALLAEVRGPTLVPGHIGSALSFFAARNEDVLATFSEPVVLGTAYTISLWVRILGRGAQAFVSCHGDPRFIARIDDRGYIEALAYAAYTPQWPDYSVQSPAPYSPGDVWRHIAAVVNGTHVELYVDGASSAARDLAATASEPMRTAECYFGRTGYSWSESWLTGDLDDVRIYPRPLTHAEVLAVAGL